MHETEFLDSAESDRETWEEEELSDSTDSELEMQGQALPVPPFDISKVDTTAIPLTSQEYIQQVIAERARLPRIVTATVPKLKTNVPKSNLCIFPIEEIEDFPHKPSDEWQKQQIFSFSRLRYKIECNKESWREMHSIDSPRTTEDWLKFLFQENSNKNVDLSQQPYLDVVLQMDNVRMENVMKYTIDLVSENKLSVYSGGMWLFALLACIEVPLCIHFVNRLRKFVLLCRRKRTEMDFSIEENKPELVALNLFICLIGKYFGQRDLAD